MTTSAAAPVGRVWVLPDEPLPVRLMSTIWADGDGPHDDLRTTADVNEWLDAVGVDRAGARTTESELSTARALRDAVRRLAAYVTQEGRPGAAGPRPPGAPPPRGAARRLRDRGRQAGRGRADHRGRRRSRPAERDRGGASRAPPRAARRPTRTGPGSGPVAGDDRACAGRRAGGRAARRAGRRPAARLLRAGLRAVLRQDPSAARVVLGRLRQPSARGPPLPAGPRPPGRRVAVLPVATG